MKQLYLLRHAQAMPAENMDDKARKLSPRGQQDAEALGKTMQKKNYVPDLVLCSAATRTQETYEAVKNTLGDSRVELEDTLYNATAGDMLHHIQQAENAQRILLVAHAPGIFELAVRLFDEGTPSLVNQMTAGYNPGALTVLNCPCEKWSEIQPGENELIDFLDPLDYNAPSTPARWT